MQDDQKTKAELLQELDILRRRVSELKQAAEEWSKTFDATSDLMFVQDKDFKFIKVNKSVCDMLKVTPEDLIGKKCYEVLHKSDKPWPNCPLEKALKDKRPHTEEVYDPNIGIPLLISTSPSFDENGELTSVVHIATDITERKKAEEKLHESEQRYRSLTDDVLDSSRVGIFILDDSFKIVWVNRALERYFDLRRKEVIGKDKRQLIREQIKDIFEDTETFVEKVLATYDNNTYIENFECHVLPDGQREDRWLEHWSQPIRSGLFAGGRIEHYTDITERKRAEDELKRKKERIEKYLDIVEVQLSIVNADESIALINKKGCAILGYKEEELIGRSWFDLLVPKRIRGEVRGVFRSLMAGSIEPGEYYENPLLTKGGQERLIAFHNTVIKDPNGQIVGVLTSGEDITERKKAEEALREGEERLRVALSAAQMGTWRWDPVTNQDTRDASLNLILGLEAVESTQPVEDFLHFVHPEDRDMVDEEIQRAIRERRTYLAEFRIIRPDGTVRWLRDQGKPLCDENDRVLCLTGAIIDITERKKAEDELKESEERFRAIFDNAADGILLADPESKRFHSGNRVMGQMLGCKPEEIKNLGVVDIHPEEDLPYVIEQFEKQSRGKFTLSRDIPVKRKDGSVFYADINSVGIALRGKRYLMGIFRDVTERKRAEEAVRDSESKYRTLVENLPQKIFLKNKNSVYVSCNENLAKDFKIKPEEIAGKTDYDFLPKELAEKYRADDKRIIESGETKDIEERYIEQGKERIIHTVKTPVKDQQGNVVGVLGIFWDITELKQAQEKLSKYREKMARAEQLASVGTLSATLAHELTQPLTVIRLSIENALAKLEATSSAATVTKKLDDSLTEVSNVTSIVERFRNYARRSSKRIAGEVDLKAVAERTVQLLSENARRARVTLHLEGMDKLPPIYSSEKDIEQLFFALVVNAVQAADGKKNRQLIISGDVKDEHVELRFSDDCGGIAPENLDRIFEPFFTTRPAGEGTGLGLCIVKQIVSRAGGKVRVESESGKGSTFFVTLPIDKGKGS